MISGNITGVQAYAAAQGAATGALSAGTGPTGAGETFGGVLEGALNGLSGLGQQADAQSAAAMTGKGNMTDVVMAVSKAEMALQATVAVRDKMVSAYQEIMRMSV